MVEFGIVSILNSFGTEVAKFDTAGIYGLAIAVIFAAVWIATYNLMSKEGTKKTPLTKGLPPVIAFAVTIYLVIDLQTASMKSAETFAKQFGSFVWFLISTALSVWLFFLGTKYNKSQRWGKFIMSALFLIGSTVMLTNFVSNPSQAAGSGFILKTFGEDSRIMILGSILAIIIVFSTIGCLFFGFKAIFNRDSSSLVETSVSRSKDLKKSAIKSLEDAQRKLKLNLDSGNRIYDQIKKVLTDKDPIDKQVISKLDSWINNLNNLKREIEDISSIDQDKVTGVLNRQGNKFKYLEKFKQDLNRSLEILNSMIFLIQDFKSKDNIIGDYNGLYAIAMEWYGFVKSTDALDKFNTQNLEDIKKELNFDEELGKELNDFKKIELEIKGDNGSFKKSLKLIEEYVYSKTDNNLKIFFEIKFYSLVLKEIKSFLTEENLKELLKGVAAGNNFFEDIVITIRNQFEDSQIYQNDLTTLKPQIRNELNKILVSARGLNKDNDLSKEAETLSGYFKILENLKEDITSKVVELKKFKGNKEEGISYILKVDFGKILVEFKDLVQKISEFELGSLKFPHFDELRDKENYISSIKKLKEAIEIEIDKLRRDLEVLLKSENDSDFDSRLGIFVDKLSKFKELLESKSEIDKSILELMRKK